MTRFYIDFEFIDNGRTIDLISVGIVSEDNRSYYAQSMQFHPKNASPWVKEHVFPHLTLCANSLDDDPMRVNIIKELRQHRRGQCVDWRRDTVEQCPWRTKAQIRHEVKAFLGEKPELWGWTPSYDYVCLCQLFGTMMDLPDGYPHEILDVQHILNKRAILDSALPAQEGHNHDALDDARYIKMLYEVFSS